MDTARRHPNRPMVHPDDRVDPSNPGERWWKYERPALSTEGPSESTPLAPSNTDDRADESGAEPAGERIKPAAALLGPHGRALAFVAVGVIVALVVGTRVFGQEGLGVLLIPVATIVLTIAFGRRCVRLRPDETWLPGLLLLGAVVKLSASYFRYFTLTQGYGGVGDATEYDKVARTFVAFWTGASSMEPVLIDYRQSNFVRIITANVYYYLGQNLLAAFLLFAAVALLGSYFWYRAVVDSVPYVNKRLFLIFMLFAPSIVFWPSSLGKEALMQVGVGAVAWATGLVLAGRFAQAIPLLAGGGWLLWVVRPHLLALVAIAAAIPYFICRIDSSGKRSFLSRPLGMVAVGGLVLFTVGAGATFLGLDEVSVDSIEAQLDATTERTAYGGSKFTPPGSALNPINIPEGVVTVLFRPFPWETSSGFQLLAAAESVTVIAFAVHRRQSILIAFRRCRRDPFILYCLLLLLFYGMTFSSFANFGLLNRQRSLVLPALYMLIAIEPKLLERRSTTPLRADASMQEVRALAGGQ